MELEIRNISLWMDVDELKAIKDDMEGNYFGSSGLLMDSKDKIVKAIMEVANRHWDIDYCHKEAHNEELPICEMCEEEVEHINDDSGMELCSDCFSDAGYGGC
tara:strand:+ start:187 stop:495 length:309 start_codon:yes stop_codon:yes gene_type:complete